MTRINVTQTKRPLRADAEQNRLKILAAAADVFAERGLDATLDDVAHRAGVGVGTVYRRFPDKESLVDALFHDRIDEVLSTAKRLSADHDAWTALTRFLELCCKMHADDRAFKQIMVGFDRHGEHTERVRNELEPLLAHLVEVAKKQGQLRLDADARDVPILMTMVGASADYAREVKPDVWRRYLVIVLDGWRAGIHNTALPIEAMNAGQLAKVMAAKGA